MKRLRKSLYAFLLVFLVACEKPAELGDEFRNHTFLRLGELGPGVRVSFSGPELEASQLIDEEARANESLFVLLEPQPIRTSRTVGSLDGGDDDGTATACNRACAQILTFEDQSMWVKGEVCREGLVATLSSLNVSSVSNQSRVYKTSRLSFPGRFQLPEQVTCYETYFYHEGEVSCEQSCLNCGAGEFACVFLSPTLVVPTELPDGIASSKTEKDCDLGDKTQCGGVPPPEGDDPTFPF